MQIYIFHLFLRGTSHHFSRLLVFRILIAYKYNPLAPVSGVFTNTLFRSDEYCISHFFSPASGLPSHHSFTNLTFNFRSQRSCKTHCKIRWQEHGKLIV